MAIDCCRLTAGQSIARCCGDEHETVSNLSSDQALQTIYFQVLIELKCEIDNRPLKNRT